MEAIHFKCTHRLVLRRAAIDGTVDVGALTPGTYVLRITDAEGAVSFTRFVKEP